MFQAGIVEKIKTHILFSPNFSENGAVYNNAGEKAKEKLVRFNFNNGYAKAPQC
jgi:hypothetical protein